MKLRHMTFDDLGWLPFADFLELPLGQRVKYVRTQLGLTQDEFARAVGTSSGRQAVIGWEKGREPRDFAEGIAGLTPYPAAAFRRSEEGAISLATLDLRLRSLEMQLQQAVILMQEALALLHGSQRRSGEGAQPRRRAS